MTSKTFDMTGPRLTKAQREARGGAWTVIEVLYGGTWVNRGEYVSANEADVREVRLNSTDDDGGGELLTGALAVVFLP